MNSVKINNEKISIPKKYAAAVVSVIFVVAAIIFLRNAYIVPIFEAQNVNIITTHIFFTVTAIISGFVLILSVSCAVFSFVKPKAWIYTALSAFISLGLGLWFFGRAWVLMSLIAESIEAFWNNIIVYVFIYSIYAVVLFAGSLLVKYIYNRKRIANDTE